MLPYDIAFKNKINHPHDGHKAGMVSSTGFLYKKDTEEIVTAYIEDDGNGILQLFEYVNNIKNIFDTSIGTVDYTNGLVTLTKFSPIEVSDGSEIYINAVPQELDIISKNNNIILIDTADKNSIKVRVYTDEQLRAGIGGDY